MNGGIELSLLGVPEASQNRAPSVAVYPPRFNPKLRSVWESIFKDSDSRELLKLKPDNQSKWDWAIREFLSTCRKQGLLPFDDKFSNVDNERISNMLAKQRLRIVNLLDSLSLLKDVTVKKVRRRVFRTPSNFTIHQEAELRIKPHRLDDFVDTLLSIKNGFIINSEGQYEKHINPHVLISFSKKAGDNYLFCYKVTHVEHPFIAPGSARGVSKKRYEDYIIKNIWVPISKKHKFKHYKGNRII